MAAENRDQIQLLYGRQIDVETINPILLSGECICVLDSDTLKPIDFKFGNGVLTYTQLPGLGDLIVDRVYSREQADELLTALGEKVTRAATAAATNGQRLETIERLIDASASSEDTLASVSTVRRILDERFGRSITFTAGGRSFPSLQDLADGPYFYNANRIDRNQLVSGDLALVDGEEFGYKYNGTAWEPNSSKMLLTTAQDKALNSGITNVDVQTFRNTAEQLPAIAEQVNRFTNTITQLSQNSATKYTAYRNVATIDVTGLNYPQYSKCYVIIGQNKVNGFILSSDAMKGTVYSIYFEDTDFDATAATSVNVFSEYGDGNCKCKITSTRVTYDVAELDRQLHSLLELYSATNLTRGPNDGKLRLVRNGQLTPVFISETTKYVDGSYTGESTGLEFAPYKTGVEALSAIRSSAEPGSIVYAAGEYNEVLDIRSGIAKNISGSAVSKQINTYIRQIQVSGVAEKIGFRDICINESFKVEGASQLYADNIRVLKETKVSIRDEASFAHCIFEGTVIVSAGVVEFDACSFSNKAILEVKEGAKVIVKNCSDVSPRIDAGGTYIQLSGSISPIKSSESRNALVASDNATFIGLFDGMAYDEGYGYAPISIGASVHYAIGSFLCDVENSRFPRPDFRRPCDGLRDLQIVTPARAAATDGYKTNSTYLSDHLTAISTRLKALADSIVASAIDKVLLIPGKTNGTLAIEAKSQDRTVYTSEDVAVPGLGTAAFTDAVLYAKAADLANYATAQSALEQAANLTALDQREQNNNNARVTDIAKANTDITTLRTDVLGGSGKKGAIAQTVEELEGKITQAVATSSGRALYPTNLGSVGGTLSSEEYPKQATVFQTLAALSIQDTSFYFRGKQVLPQKNDKALYWEDATYTKQCQAIYTCDDDTKIGGWSYYASMSITFTTEQMAAINSGVTAAAVAKLDIQGLAEDTIPDAIAKKQDKLARPTKHGRVEHYPKGSVVTYEENADETPTVGARQVVDTIGVLTYNAEENKYGIVSDVDAYSAQQDREERDLPTAKSVFDLVKLFAKYLEQQISAKVKTPLPDQDGLVARTTTEGVSQYVPVTDEQLRIKVAPILEPYYTKEQTDAKFAKTLVRGAAKQILATPAADEANAEGTSVDPIKLSIRDNGTDTIIKNEPDADKEAIPTVGVISRTVKALQDSIDSKQTKIAPATDATTIKVLTRTATEGAVDDLSVRRKVDPDSTEPELAAVDYVDEKDRVTNAKVDTLTNRLFGRLDAVGAPEGHEASHNADRLAVYKQQTIDNPLSGEAETREVLVDCGLTVETILGLAAEGNFRSIIQPTPNGWAAITSNTAYFFTDYLAATKVLSAAWVDDHSTPMLAYSNVILSAPEYVANGTRLYFGVAPVKPSSDSPAVTELLASFTNCIINLDLSGVRTRVEDENGTRVLSFYNSTICLRSTEEYVDVEQPAFTAKLYSTKARIDLAAGGLAELALSSSIVDVYEGTVKVLFDPLVSTGLSTVVLHNRAKVSFASNIGEVTKPVIVVYADDYKDDRVPVSGKIAINLVDGRIYANEPELKLRLQSGTFLQPVLNEAGTEKTFTLPEMDDGDVV